MYRQKVTSKKNCVKKLVFCWHLEGQWQNSRMRIQDPDPDPLVRGIDPRIRIHTKMSWIRNTGYCDSAFPVVWWHFLFISCLRHGVTVHVEFDLRPAVLTSYCPWHNLTSYHPLSQYMRPPLTYICPPTTLPQVRIWNKKCYFDSAFLCVQSHLFGFFFFYLSCLKHGPVYNQFDLVPPYPTFEPRVMYIIAIVLFLVYGFCCVSPVSSTGPPFILSSTLCRPTKVMRSFFVSPMLQKEVDALQHSPTPSRLPHPK